MKLYHHLFRVLQKCNITIFTIHCTLITMDECSMLCPTCISLYIYLGGFQQSFWNFYLWFTFAPPPNVRAKNVPTDEPYKSSVSKNIVNSAVHTVLLQISNLKLLWKRIWQDFRATTEQRWRAMTDFSNIFLYFGLCGLSGRGAVTKVGVLEIYKKRQHQAEPQQCVWHSDTNTHTRACNGCVPAPLQTAS